MEQKSTEISANAKSDLETKEDDDDSTQYMYRKNPLEISVVIRCVLEYLNFEDTKNCRLISKEWSSVGLLNLKVRSKIVLAKGRFQGKYYARTPASFRKLFPESEESLPFTAFKITSFNECPMKGKWSVTELNNFFEIQKNNIRELELQNVYITYKQGISGDGFDIGPWIADLPMIKPDTKFNTKLSISCDKGIRFAVKLSSLVNIKEIELEKCKVYLEEDLKICPIGLKLFNVQFLRNETRLLDICLNDVADLSLVQKLQLYCDPEVVPNNDLNALDDEFRDPPVDENKYKDTYLSFNMRASDFSLEYFYFHNVKLNRKIKFDKKPYCSEPLLYREKRKN